MPRAPEDPVAADDFTAVVREHGDAVFGFLLRRVGDRGIAEDLTQGTFLRAWRARAGLRERESMRGWLCTIAANLLRDHVRHQRRRVREVAEPEHFDIPAAEAEVSDRVEMAEALDRLRDALAALPARQRELFLLRERDGLSYREIATVLGCPIGSVMSGLSRARERLIRAVEA